MDTNGVLPVAVCNGGQNLTVFNNKSLPSNQKGLHDPVKNSREQDENKRVQDDKLTLSREALAIIRKLKTRDREVKQHERAHMAAGGPYITGAPTYTYQTGPDGKRYAIGGEVHIDTSPERDPEATIRKMETVKRAALAPSKPSNQDRMVAARASMEEQKARLELSKEKQDEAFPFPEEDSHLWPRKGDVADG